MRGRTASSVVQRTVSDEAAHYPDSQNSTKECFEDTAYSRAIHGTARIFSFSIDAARRSFRGRAPEYGVRRAQRGFTLIEIAIVMVVVGFLLGGVLKGQELIASAHVRQLIAQTDGIKAAFFGFHDRFRSAPGDYAFASRTLKCPGTATCLNGNGNGIIEGNAGTILLDLVPSEVHEELLAWTHLSSGGFIDGSYAMLSGETVASESNSPKNPYNVYLQIIYDNEYADNSVAIRKHNLKTGPNVPVGIIAEVDRKIDDGNGMRGAFRYSKFLGNATTAPLDPNPVYMPGHCLATSGQWFSPQGEINCGGAVLL